MAPLLRWQESSNQQLIYNRSSNAFLLPIACLHMSEQVIWAIVGQGEAWNGGGWSRVCSLRLFLTVLLVCSFSPESFQESYFPMRPARKCPSASRSSFPPGLVFFSSPRSLLSIPLCCYKMLKFSEQISRAGVSWQSHCVFFFFPFPLCFFPLRSNFPKISVNWEQMPKICVCACCSFVCLLLSSIPLYFFFQDRIQEGVGG